MLPAIAQKIVAEVSKKVGLELVFEGFHVTGGVLKVRMVKSKKQAVIVGLDGGNPFRFTIRSLLTRRREGKRIDWLCNGQPGYNCMTVGEWLDDSFEYRFTKEDVEATWREWYGEEAGLRYQHAKEKGLLKLPAWLS